MYAVVSTIVAVTVLLILIFTVLFLLLHYLEPYEDESDYHNHE